MSAAVAVLWMCLSVLCMAKAIISLPPRPKKRRHYLVSYQAEGGISGMMGCSVKMPLTAKRVTEIREYIQGLDTVKPRRVVITNIMEIEP